MAWDGIEKRKACNTSCIDIETIKEEMGEMRVVQAVLSEKVTAFLDSTVVHRRDLKDTLDEIKKSLPDKKEIADIATFIEKVKSIENNQKVVIGGFVTVICAFAWDLIHRVYK